MGRWGQTDSANHRWGPDLETTVPTRGGGFAFPFRGTSCVDANTGWAVGYGGNIYGTTRLSSCQREEQSMRFLLLRTLRVLASCAMALPATSSAQPGWFWQNPRLEGNTLAAVSAAGRGIIVAVGDSGTILRTADFGASWAVLSSGTPNALWGVSFVDADNGIAVGDLGTILRTTNGGITWTTQFSGIAYPLTGVSFVDVNTAIAVGDFGTILRSIDGGSTWTRQASGTDNLLFGVSFSDEITGTVVGNFGTILRTSDGGATWTFQSSGATQSLYGVSFV